MDGLNRKILKRRYSWAASHWWLLLAIFTSMFFCVSSDLSTSDPPTTAPASAVGVNPKTTVTPRSFDYIPYLKGINGWLKDDDLEYELDYYNEKEKSLLIDLDFDPEKTVRILIDSAAQNTTPEQFLGDIQDLMYLQNRSKIESKDNLSGDKSFRESWKNELKRLEKKYRVSSDSTDPEQPVTATRLTIMFPHFLNLGQKPFGEARNEICVSSDDDDDSSRCVPAFFQRPEFGGLIPREGTMNETARQAVFTLHMYFLGQSDTDNTAPFRTKCVLVKRRMTKSLVSDERRRRLLENNDVIRTGGELTASMEKAYDVISADFKEAVFLTRGGRGDVWPPAYVPQRMQRWMPPL